MLKPVAHTITTKA